MLLSNGNLVVVFLIVLCNFQQNESTPSNKSEDISKVKFTKLLTSIANMNEQRLNALKKYTALDRYSVASDVLRHANHHQQRPVLAIYMLHNKNPERTLLYEVYGKDKKPISKAPKGTPAHNTYQFIQDYYDYFEDNRETKKELRNYIDDADHDSEEKLFNRKRIGDGKETSDGEEIIPGKENSNRKKTSSNNKSSHEEKTFFNNKGSFKEGNSYGKEQIKLLSNGTKIENKKVLRIWKSCSKKAAKMCKKACKSAIRRVCDSYRCSSSMKRSFKKHCKSSCKEKFLDEV